MLIIGDYRYSEQVLSPELKEPAFPNGFGLEIAPVGHNLGIDLEAWITKFRLQALQLVNDWGALVVRSCQLEPKSALWEVEKNGHKGYVEETAWHTEQDAGLEAILYARKVQSSPRNIPMQVAPSSAVEKMIRESTNGIKHHYILTPATNSVLKKCQKTQDQSVGSTVELEAMKHIQLGLAEAERQQDYRTRAELYNILRDTNAENSGSLLTHNWEAKPDSAILVHNNPDTPRVVHSTIKPTQNFYVQGAPLWRLKLAA